MLLITANGFMKKNRNLYVQKFMRRIHSFLLAGSVNMFKYTYSALASFTFMALTCINIGDQSVWKYDAKISCFSSWQYVYVVIAVVHIIPFPVLFYIGSKSLENKLISPVQFAGGCLIPLPFLCHGIIHICYRKIHDRFSKLLKAKKKAKSVGKNPGQSREKSLLRDKSESRIPIAEPSQKESDTIYNKDHHVMLYTLPSPYKAGELTSYWDSVIIIRRLLISALFLVSVESFIKFALITVLCIAFLVNRAIYFPFKNVETNRAETLSLFFLTFCGIINLLKSERYTV